MELKALEFKEYKHVKYSEIVEKHRMNFYTEPINFTIDELKSLLSILFSIHYHLPEISKGQNDNINATLYEKNDIVNITSNFGRQMIENLDTNYNEWLNSLQKESYVLSNVLIDKALTDFVNMVLIDYMVIRKFEYGKYFLNQWSKSIIDSRNLFLHFERIKNAIVNKTDPTKIIGEIIQKANKNLSIPEGLLLVFTLKEIILKPSNSFGDYALTNFIVRDNIFDLSLKKNIFKNTINESLKQRWNLDRGKGGPKL